ncbi:MAG: FAD-dependent oxidoreductase [Pyrodictiaceae archaeon]
MRLEGLAKLEPEYDVVIVGGGPAAFSAAIYASRFSLKAVIITDRIGGLLTEAGIVDDYLGIPEVHASKLIMLFQRHVRKYGVRIVLDKVTRFYKNNETKYYIVETMRRRRTKTKTVIVAIGTRRRKLGVPGEQEFLGKGVSYCSICDAPLYKDSDAVAVVGGGDAALEGAVMLSDYAKKVYLIHRRSRFRAQPYYVKQVLSRPNIELVLDSIVTEIRGRERVEEIVVKNLKSGVEKTIRVDGVFIEIGFEPHIEWAKLNGLELDEKGYIKVDEWMRTNLPGVFAAGDCTNKWYGFRQIITAAAMGAVAAYSAYNYILQEFGEPST